LDDAAQRLGRDQQAHLAIVNGRDPNAEAEFEQAVAKNLTRNYVSQLMHGMLAMTGFRLVNTPTFVPAYLFTLSGSPTTVALVLAAQQLGAFASSLFGVTMIEHRRRILPLGLAYGWAMRLSVLGLALVAFFLPQPFSLWAFAIFLGLLGIFSGMQNVLWNVLMTKTIPPNRRGMLMGARNFLGGMTASAVAYWGAQTFVQHNVLGNGYATTFLVAFVLTALGLTFLNMVREPDAPSVREQSSFRRRILDVPLILRQDPQFALYFVAQSIATLGALALPFYIIFAGRRLGFNGDTIGWLSLALLVSQTTANLFWGWIADRAGFKAVFVPALFLWAAGTVAFAFSPNLAAFLGCFIAIGAGNAGYQIASQNMVMEFGARADLPLRLGLVNSAQSLVLALGPILGGELVQTLGYEAVFAAAALAMFAAAVMLLVYVREPRRRSQAEGIIDADQGFTMSVSGESASFPGASNAAAAPAQSSATERASVPPRPRSPLRVRAGDILWTLFPALGAFAILALWTGQWFFCLVLAIAIAAVGLARLGFVRSLPLPEAPAPAPAAKASPSPAAEPVSGRNNDEFSIGDVVQRLPDPVIVTDQNGRVVAANAALEALFGRAEPRKHLASIIRAPQVLEGLDAALAGKGSQRAEFSMISTPEQNFQAYISPVESEEGHPRAALIVLQDMTKAKRVEQMRADFVANASHELRTPLASLTGFIDTLRGHAKDDPEAQERFLGIMAEQASRMRRLIDDLLSLSRIELNEHVRPSGSINLGDVIEEVTNALTPVADAAHMTMDLVEPMSLPNVAGDREELIQVFTNLIDNAIKYGKPGMPITVELGTRRAGPGEAGPSPAVYVAVKDHGEGIAREHIPRLTERFYRVDVRRSRAIGGTGLGLAIVKHILNRHRGRLAIESKVGEGSTFTVFLPLATEAGPADSQPTGLLTAS
jgi:signal transduction histidine kinase/Na+/melibiose symporter-like transporter